MKYFTEMSAEVEGVMNRAINEVMRVGCNCLERELIRKLLVRTFACTIKFESI